MRCQLGTITKEKGQFQYFLECISGGVWQPFETNARLSGGWVAGAGIKCGLGGGGDAFHRPPMQTLRELGIMIHVSGLF